MFDPTALGLLWEDLPPPRRTGGGPRVRGPMPPVPETGWRPVTEFPNLSGAKVIGFDTETWDPDLNDAGPGWGRGRGHLVGASLSVEDGTSWYFPIRHGIEHGKQILPPEEAAMNMDPDQVMRFLQHTLGDIRPKVGANLIYDVGWLQWEGVKVKGPLFDVQFAEALLNSETPDVSLEGLGQEHLGMGKETSVLYDWLASWCGGKASDRQRANLFLSPPSLAGPYGEADASLPIQILAKQWPKLVSRGVLDLFYLECKLIPLLVAMRMKGSPVNVAKAEQLYDRLGDKLGKYEEQLVDLAGQPVNPNASESVKAAFQKLSIPLPQKLDKKTGEMKVSFAAPMLEEIDHPLCHKILEWRQISKVRGTFVKGYIIDKNVNGRVYTSFHPLKGDGHGARSGRFASSDPNLQNIPIRSDTGKLVRALFECVSGGRWRSFDYSSIEYRLLVHYAVGPGSDEVRARYAADPTVDYHKIVADLILKLTGLELDRGKTKTINFGIIYGMALNALALALNLPKTEAKKLLDSYHAAIPYARETMDMSANEVHTTGMVRTIMNRASDFNQWGRKGFSEDRTSLDYEAACRKWGPYNIERQHTHKALNRKLQGSAADILKAAMVKAWEDGLFNDSACGVPVLTVHDELDFEDMGDPDNPAWAELKRTMETCMGPNLLRVPLLVEGGIGANWAEAH